MSIFGLVQDHQDRSKPAFKSEPGATTFAALLGAVGSTKTSVPAQIDATKTVPSPTNAATSDSLLFLNRLWDAKPFDSVNSTSPDAFVHSITDAAKLAAQELGTSTAAVIAVAALETGWGKHIITSHTGDSSNNLFGIKATDNNPATTAYAETAEFVHGVKKTLTEPFRTYQSASDSVADFAHFIQSNPRYTKALSQAQDANAFIDQIHQAGYATDPNYASKVKSVMSQVERIMRDNHDEARL